MSEDVEFPVKKVNKGGRPRKTNIDLAIPATDWQIDLKKANYQEVFNSVITPNEFMGVMQSILVRAKEGSYRHHELIVRMAGMYEPQPESKGEQNDELFALLGIKRTL